MISCVFTALFQQAKRPRRPHKVSAEANYETSILRDLQIYSAANLAIYGKFTTDYRLRCVEGEHTCFYWLLVSSQHTSSIKFANLLKIYETYQELEFDPPGRSAHMQVIVAQVYLLFEVLFTHSFC